MTDDKKPRPDYDSEPLPTPKTISDLYDAPAAIRLLNALFPRDQVDTLHALTGVPVRSITRWLSGVQRIPPTLLQKFRDQNALRRQFVDDLQTLLAKHSEAGLLHEAMRQAILTEINGDFFKNEESL